jgi:hypothetical protein
VSSPVLPGGGAKLSNAFVGAFDPAGTCHACQYLTEEGVIADPSGFVPRMVLDTSSTMYPPLGDAWASCHFLPQFEEAGPPLLVASRSHWPSRSTPVTVMVAGTKLPLADTRSLSAEKEAVLPSIEVEVKLERQSPVFGQ